jgi:hypothetical protein
MSETPIRERRRGERVIIRIPVILYGLTKDNHHISEEAETVAISRTGALVRTRNSFKTGGVIEVTNGFSKQADKFRVVWASDAQKQGCYDLGIEMLTPRDDFWGLSFPSTASAKS